MLDNRVLGLSRNQSVPRLLSKIGGTTASTAGKVMKDIPDDASPRSSSGSSDDDGLSRRADIQPSQFRKTSQGGSPHRRNLRRGRVVGDTLAVTLGSQERSGSIQSDFANEPASSPKDTDSTLDVTKIGHTSSPPPAKKLKRSSPEGASLGSHFADDRIFPQTRPPGKRSAKWTYGFRGRREKTRAKASVTPPDDSDTVTESPPKNRFRNPSPLPKPRETPASPKSGFKHPGKLDSPVKSSPIPKKWPRIPPKEKSGLLADDDSADASQLCSFKMPEEEPGFFDDIDEREELDLTIDLTADASTASNMPQLWPSPLIDLHSPDAPTHLCPMCNQDVGKDRLGEFKREKPFATVSDMQRFCQDHKQKSARKEWSDRGYPDIDWTKLDRRIAKHYDFLREILEGERKSHYAEKLRDQVRSGQNRTLLKSDTNLTPGYYGIRGLRAMSENLIGQFSALLRKRALQDRLVSARGHTAYLQSVLVPELAVRLIMEDMMVEEEEAREILAESCRIGELLNDEIGDVVDIREDRRVFD